SAKNASGEQRHSVVIGFADSTMAVKGVLYDTSKLNLVKDGTTVMLLNVIMKNDSAKSIVITNSSKILKTGPLEVPESLIKQGKAIACPPPADKVDIKSVQTSPVKTLVTLRGQVVSEEMERSVHVDAEDTHIRTIKVKDNSGSCKVSLWRELTKQKTPVGSHITLTNVVVQVYNDEKSVSTTIEAILGSALRCAAVDVENNLTKKLPVSATATVKENNILHMTIKSLLEYSGNISYNHSHKKYLPIFATYIFDLL
ncbi:uncharacterized protein LOC130049384, partial [Ostrea edulis]|uniref:uncharacterized protein LOC130049384 n=1 Tax=Ostrea edulis TaxID=37623 RepID=UPI0024AF9818